MRTFDKKHLCVYFMLIENSKFNSEYPSLDERVKWCYENIPEARLWCYEYEKSNRIINIYGIPEQGWTLRFKLKWG